MKRIIMALAIAGVARLSFAQNSSTDTLRMSMQQCVDYALLHQLSVRNAQLDEQIAQRNTQAVTAQALPQVSAVLDFSDYLHLPTTLIPAEFFGGEAGTFVPLQFGTKYNASATATLSQLVFDGRYFLGLKATRALGDLSFKTTTKTKIETIETIEKSYMAALIAEQRLTQLDASIIRFKKTYDDTKALYQSGFVEKLDVDRITVGYNNLLSQRDQVSKLLQLGVLMLKFQMGIDVNQPFAFTDSIREGNFQEILQNAAAPNIQNRIEYQVLQTSISLGQMNVKQYKVGYLPTLYAIGQYSYTGQRENLKFFESNTWFNTTMVGFKLTLPIFDGLQKARNIQSAKLSLQKDENSLMDFTNAMNLQVNSAKTTLQNAISTLETQKSNLQLAKEVVDISRKKYEQGVGSSLDITDSESSLKDAQVNYLTALYDAWVATIDLEKALGILDKQQ